MKGVADGAMGCAQPFSVRVTIHSNAFCYAAGCTNLLFKVISELDHIVLVRIYGAKSDLIIDRVRERKVLAAIDKAAVTQAQGKTIYTLEDMYICMYILSHIGGHW